MCDDDDSATVVVSMYSLKELDNLTPHLSVRLTGDLAEYS